MSVVYNLPISGAASGNASALQNTPVATTAPTDGQVLSYSNSGASWAPADASGGGLPSAFTASNTLTSELLSSSPGIAIANAFDTTGVTELLFGSQDSSDATGTTNFIWMTSGAITNATNTNSGGTGGVNIYTGDNLSTAASNGDINTGTVGIYTGIPSIGYSGDILIQTSNSNNVQFADWSEAANYGASIQFSPGRFSSTNDTNYTAQSLIVMGGPVQILPPTTNGATAFSQPTAVAALDGVIWFTKGGVGVADTLQICMKSASNTYSWKTIVTG